MCCNVSTYPAYCTAAIWYHFSPKFPLSRSLTHSSAYSLGHFASSVAWRELCTSISGIAPPLLSLSLSLGLDSLPTGLPPSVASIYDVRTKGGCQEITRQTSRFCGQIVGRGPKNKIFVDVICGSPSPDPLCPRGTSLPPPSLQASI